MARTARSQFPRAVQKDRHENRSGLDPNLRKGGAGSYNWGNIMDERELHTEALHDEGIVDDGELVGRPLEQDIIADQQFRAGSPADTTSSGPSKPGLSRSRSHEEELEEARKARKNMLNKKNIDLSAIARTSVGASTSPPRSDGMLRGPGRSDKDVPISATTRLI
ncbi:hypothetical protein CC1G_11460 [Coprinopsis cinerea okayama7|uniref:Hyaluronan/mRNA-binding protein domain-containing protein n=1 Tax=Coprinopsis cinerea (strain Okayama-7 / 130 / ATCC MYA-4618 / FGSC 9003) TaxID=240176 RepID=A8P038_COPC7|nr:hypothetical protein CC1G_11460 [Coprinopsis cinerea okayama7\|eukprot:XP_001837815.1 hypothetical protein CC1G_11460 [Coprinopsis cinerea okayama7\